MRRRCQLTHISRKHRIVIFYPILLFVLLLSGAVFASAQEAADVVRVTPAQVQAPGDLQALVNAHEPGTTFIFEPGIYRLQQITPQDQMRFVGQPGTVLSGAQVLTDFRQEGPFWYVSGQRQGHDARGAGRCLESAPRCDYPEDVYFDGQPLTHAAGLDLLVPGGFYFDYVRERIYIADDPTEHIVETSVIPIAFDGMAWDVVIEGLTLEKYANPSQVGMIHGDFGRGWQIIDSVVRHGHGTGIRIHNDMRIINTQVVHHGQIGIAGVGANVQVIDSEIAYNNFAGYNAGWEAGGSKFVRTSGLVLRGNYVHHNRGPGLWTDIENDHVLIEANKVEYNTGNGIMHEISYTAIIRDNVVRYNASDGSPWLFGAQILVMNSSGVGVYNNTVTVAPTGGNGISLIHQDRGDGLYGVYRTEQNRVMYNSITFEGSSGLTGGAADFEQDAFYAAPTNVFDYNTYYVVNRDAQHWRWRGAALSWEDFRAAGKEPNGQRLELTLAAGARAANQP